MVVVVEGKTIEKRVVCGGVVEGKQKKCNSGKEKTI